MRLDINVRSYYDAGDSLTKHWLLDNGQGLGDLGNSGWVLLYVVSLIA